tara:strand:+ start:4359 stop:4712 length:354 start_codon:yes stop_codon:yes gene_type:complete
LRKTPVKKYTEEEFRILASQGTIKSERSKTVRKIASKKTEYKIEKNIPIPSSNKSLHFPLTEMEIGDSFLISLSKRAAIRNAIARLQKKSKDYKFVTRTVSGRGRKGKQLRVWRIDT